MILSTDWARFYVHGCHAVTPPSRAMPAQALARVDQEPAAAWPTPWPRSRLKLVHLQAQGILLDIDGNIAENKGGNFFIVADGVLKTPLVSNALAGISRATVIEAPAGSLGIGVRETNIQPYDVYTADEAFFTSTPYWYDAGDALQRPASRRRRGWPDYAVAAGRLERAGRRRYRGPGLYL